MKSLDQHESSLSGLHDCVLGSWWVVLCLLCAAHTVVVIVKEEPYCQCVIDFNQLCDLQNMLTIFIVNTETLLVVVNSIKDESRIGLRFYTTSIRPVVLCVRPGGPFILK